MAPGVPGAGYTVVGVVPTTGSHVSREKIEVYDRELQRIAAAKGRLVSEDVLESARSRKSPIHDWFEWDDTIAAEAYRLRQAGDLIRAVSIVMTRPSGEEETVRKYTITRTSSTGGAYVETKEVLKDGVLLNELLQDTVKTIRLHISRFNLYTEFGGVLRELELIEHRIRKP